MTRYNNTSEVILKAIQTLTKGNKSVFRRIWEKPTEAELQKIWARVTVDGLHPSCFFCWGGAGYAWAEGLVPALMYVDGQIIRKKPLSIDSVLQAINLALNNIIFDEDLSMGSALMWAFTQQGISTRVPNQNHWADHLESCLDDHQVHWIDGVTNQVINYGIPLADVLKEDLKYYGVCYKL